MLEAEGLEVYKLLITGRQTPKFEDCKLLIPKETLVYNAVVLLEHGRLIIQPDLKLASEARKEFENFRSRPSSTDSQNLSYEALHSKDSYDNLVLAIITGLYFSSVVSPAIRTSDSSQTHAASFRGNYSERFRDESLGFQPSDFDELLVEGGGYCPNLPGTDDIRRKMRGTEVWRGSKIA